MDQFRIDIPDSDLTDLRRRLRDTRWPTTIEGSGWERGVPLDYLRNLVDYWADDFDWRGVEREVNTFPQFTDQIDGTTIHYLHARSQREDATPLLLTHGWPGSFLEFLDVIGPLTDPEAHGSPGDPAFHVVVPTIPGHGFSGPLASGGWDVDRVARAWSELMFRLGYVRYLVQGGDWGQVISLRTAEWDPQHCAGVHLNMLVTFPPPNRPDALVALPESELAKLQRLGEFEAVGLGWQRIQATRPQTLAYPLADSPVGQLAWMVDKFQAWSAATDRPEEVIPRDRLLALVSLYWFTNSGGPSAQLYYESCQTMEQFGATWAGPWKVTQPVAVAVFPDEVCPPIRAFAEAIVPDLARWTELPAGGHFAALEQPEALIADIRAFRAQIDDRFAPTPS